jgi:hypothetical protein
MFVVRTVQRIWLGYFFSGWLGFDSVGFTGCSRRISVFWPPAFRFASHLSARAGDLRPGPDPSLPWVCSGL